MAEDRATSKERRWWFRTMPHGIWRSCARLVVRVGHAVIHRVHRAVSRRRVCLHGKIGKMLSCTLAQILHTLLDASRLTTPTLFSVYGSAEPRSRLANAVIVKQDRLVHLSIFLKKESLPEILKSIGCLGETIRVFTTSSLRKAGSRLYEV